MGFVKAVTIGCVVLAISGCGRIRRVSGNHSQPLTNSSGAPGSDAASQAEAQVLARALAGSPGSRAGTPLYITGSATAADGTVNFTLRPSDGDFGTGFPTFQTSCGDVVAVNRVSATQ